jgi:hypothetical protein
LISRSLSRSLDFISTSLGIYFRDPLISKSFSRFLHLEIPIIWGPRILIFDVPEFWGAFREPQESDYLSTLTLP